MMIEKHVEIYRPIFLGTVGTVVQLLKLRELYRRKLTTTRGMKISVGEKSHNVTCRMAATLAVNQIVNHPAFCA